MSEFAVLQPGIELSIEDVIKTCAAAFEEHGLVYGHGTDDAISEASWLVLHALSLSPQVQPDYSQVLSKSQIESCNSIAVRRIVERVPAAYITGTAWFAGLEFYSDERALVPRSPLAEFIMDEFYGLAEPGDVHTVLDLCTGGGCIAIACSTLLPHAKVDASDLSPDALALAKQNVARHALQDKVTLIQGSLFEPIQGRYDLIISNPPYVDKRDISEMGAEFSHEPMMGLAAGDDGLDLVRIMLAQAAKHLTDKGVLVVEVGNSAEALEAAYPEVPFLWLEFEFGGMGIFALTRDELIEHAESISAGLVSS